MYNKHIDNSLCQKPSEPLETLNNLEHAMRGYIGKYDNINCFSEVNKTYNQVIIQVANIIVNTFERFKIGWEKYYSH